METASDCLMKHIGHNLYFDLNVEQIGRITEAMKDFACQHVRGLATKWTRVQFDRLTDKKALRRLTKENIEHIYPLTNIK